MSKYRKQKSKASYKGFMSKQKPEKSPDPRGQSSKLKNSKEIIQNYNSGVQYYQSGKLQEAELCFQQVVKWQPDRLDAWQLLGRIAFEQKQYTKATERIEWAIELNPDYPDAHNNLGNVLRIQGKLEEAISSYRHALKLKPSYYQAHNNLGLTFQEQGKVAEAIASYEHALQLNPDYPDAHYNLGNALKEHGKLDEAIAPYQCALRLKPDYHQAHYNLGYALQEQGKLDEAISSYQSALQFNPDYLDTHYNLGTTLLLQGKLEEATASYQRALQLKPDYHQIHNNLGIALGEQGKLEEAIASYNCALLLKPDYSEAHYNLGNALKAQGKLEEAIASYQRALQFNPDYPGAHYNLGNALQEQGQLKAALASYEDALKLNPDYQLALQQYVLVRRLICNWDNLNRYEKSAISSVQSGESTFPPFVMLAVTDDPAIQLAASRNFWTHRIGNSLSPLWTGQRYSHDKIRLAYLSADFHQHATAYLMAELFELHDRSKFELFAISFGPEDSSPMRQRLVRAFDRFIDVRHLSHLEAAQQIRDLEIDIAVDLKGHTKDSRPQILAHRPTPIQVNYLGYPGTMGADCIDYILVDPFIVPLDQHPHFTEKLVHLPECYQVNDRRRTIADRIPSREDCGLPPQGFVFCSFNNSYKITPIVFDIWMRLLAAVPGSVLWLLGNNSSMEGNLRREARARGINPESLIFAPRLTLPEHLARHRLADLFLDNYPCNAHTTTSDALWAGLPVLTCAGRSFASRVAGSLLHAIGLPELVTDTLEEYEALALKLATEPERLHQIKQKLQHNRLNTPLFDCDRFRRHIEAAYTQMWSRWQSGEEPKAFAVKAEVRSSPVEVTVTAKPNMFPHLENESKSTIFKQDNRKPKATPTFIFTITPGHTGTMFLASLLKINISPSQIYHERLGYDKFGVDTPDISHLTLFNSQGNIEKIRGFWRRKFDRIIKNKTCSFYGETSHILAKAGLMENIEILCKHGEVKIVCLKRDTFKVVNSLAKRFDFLNKVNMWLWHLDPDYPRKIVDPKPFVTYGINGIRLWYVYEMYARAEYYKSLYRDNPRLSFIDIDISDLSSPENVQDFLAALGVPYDREDVKFPEHKNVSNRAVNQETVNHIKELVDRISFDPFQLANEFINQGQKL